MNEADLLSEMVSFFQSSGVPVYTICGRCGNMVNLDDTVDAVCADCRGDSND